MNTSYVSSYKQNHFCVCIVPSCAYIRVMQCLQHGSRVDRHRYTKRSGRPHGTQLYIPLVAENRTLDTRFQSLQNKRFDCFPIINISRIIASLHCCNQRPALVVFSFFAFDDNTEDAIKGKVPNQFINPKKNLPRKRNIFLRLFLFFLPQKGYRWILCPVVRWTYGPFASPRWT